MNAGKMGRFIGKIAANIGLWLAAHVGASIAASAVLWGSWGTRPVFWGGGAGIPGPEPTGFAYYPLFVVNYLREVMFLSVYVWFFTLLFAVILSALPEAFGRKPKALAYAGYGFATAAFCFLFFHSFSFDLSGEAGRDLAFFLPAGFIGGFALGKLRTGFLHAR